MPAPAALHCYVDQAAARIAIVLEQNVQLIRAVDSHQWQQVMKCRLRDLYVGRTPFQLSD
jgi:hypothetical protein